MSGLDENELPVSKFLLFVDSYWLKICIFISGREIWNFISFFSIDCMRAALKFVHFAPEFICLMCLL